jgi:hypothetical protein
VIFALAARLWLLIHSFSSTPCFSNNNDRWLNQNIVSLPKENLCVCPSIFYLKSVPYSKKLDICRLFQSLLPVWFVVSGSLQRIHMFTIRTLHHNSLIQLRHEVSWVWGQLKMLACYPPPPPTYATTTVLVRAPIPPPPPLPIRTLSPLPGQHTVQTLDLNLLYIPYNVFQRCTLG